ncbi:MAG: hypothetical protein OEV92_12270, partial [Nitrospinota bacterium]|nr:hypothetical protein [Nitrospinota bacterium]
ADIQIPGFLKFIIKYVTPTFLLAILGSWFYQNILMIFLAPDDETRNGLFLVQMFSGENWGYAAASMAGMGLFLMILIALVEMAFNRKETAK